MKWIPLSERKPAFKNCIQGKILFCTSKYAQNDDWNNFKSEFTHWLEFELPPLPELEKPKDPDWEELEESMERWRNNRIPNEHMIGAFYRFLKAKYGK